MVDISSQNNKINITVSSSGNTANTNVTPDYAQYYSEKSKEWATSNRIVDNIDYSSKYYANESKKQADISTAKATEVITSGNTAVSNIENTRDNAINDVNTAGATQVALATEQATIATNKTSEVVESGNTALANIDTAKNNAITSITNQETTSKTSLIDEGATQIGLIQNEGATQVANVQSTGFYMRDDKLYFINSQGEETEFKSGGSGLEICDIGMSLYVDETKGLRRYLNGQIVDINTNTQAFLNRLKDITTLHPSLLCTEDEWQTAKTMSVFGQVGKFVFNYSGGEIVSVRLPRVVNVQGLFDLQNLGMTVNESLPNIAGNAAENSTATEWNYSDNIEAHFNGALYVVSKKNSGIVNTGSNATKYNLGFDASRSSSTYKDNAPVQQEAIQYPYFIQIATGQETKNNIVNEIELNTPSFFGDSKYVPTKVNNLSWLKSEGQSNPKGTYPSFYGWILENVNKGEKGFKLSTASDITDYDFVINTTDETFRLPLLNGEENIISDKYDELTPENGVKYVAPANGVYCFNGTDNAVKGTHNVVLRRNDRYYGVAGESTNHTAAWTAVKLNVRRGDAVYLYYGGASQITDFKSRFYYATGNGSLYYYVGETVQNANLIDAGRIGEILPTKLDASKVKAYIVETYQNGTSWYRIWSDGWCEQGGQTAAKGAASTVTTVNFLKPFANANYCALATDYATTTSVVYFGCTSFTTSSMAIITNAGAGRACRWMVAGYIN